MLQLRLAVSAILIALCAGPVQAAVVFEWHQIAAITSGPATNPPVAANAAFNPDPMAGGLLNLSAGQVVFLQLMIRDTTGTTFPWAYGDGLVPPPPNSIFGTGFFGIGVGVRGTPGVLDAAPVDNAANRRLVVLPDSENPIFPTTGTTVQPYSGPIWTPQPLLAGMDFQCINNLADENPWENGDFPRQRPGTVSYLMPLLNMRFVHGAGGVGTLTIIDARPGPTNNDNWVGVENTSQVALDDTLFGSAPIIFVGVPEPSSMVLTVLTIIGGWRMHRRRLAKRMAI